MKTVQLSLICTCIFGISCVKADCQFGSNTNEGNPDNSLRGQFADLENPLTCSGSIVAWHFCFYTDGLVNAQEGTPYTARFRVYRSVDTNQLQRVHDVQRGLTPSQLVGRENIFLCFDDLLEPDRYLDVLEGDILAVFIPVIFSPLLLVGANTQGRVYRDIRSTGAPFGDLTLPLSGLMMLENHAIHLYADVVGTTQITITGQDEPASKVTPAMLPFTATVSNVALTSETPVLHINSIQASTPTYGATISRNSRGDASFQTTTAQPTNVSLEVASSRLDTVGIVAIAIAGVLSVTVLILVTMILTMLLKQQRKSKGKKKLHISVGSTDSHDGPMETQIPYRVPPVPQVILSGELPSIDSFGYHVIEPRVLSSSGAVQRMETVQYEQVSAEVFHIYESATRPSSTDVTSHLRKVVSSLQRATVIPYCVPESEEQKVYQQLSQHELPSIPPCEILVTEHLGSGQFSEVEKAQWISSHGRAEVAVKTLHSDATGRSKIRCLQEAAMMAQFHHPNVVTLHGIVREGNKISLVMEFLVNGDLKQYLLRMRTSFRDIDEANKAKYLLSYSQQVALGMLYLSDKDFIHRDLAARNVFVSEKDICKVGDFGMSRDLADAEYYVSEGGTIPIKWTAPEAVYYHKYSTASDVWSFGCLLYEIWSMGHKPFVNTFNADVLRKLSTGFRLPPPPGCPHDIYKLMIECWNPSADSRPGFQDILVSLLGDEQQVLAIPIDDASTCHLASCLGASLEAGHKMYPYLQEMYKSANSPSFNHPTYEPTACPGSNKHGLVYINEKTSSLKQHQEQKVPYYNVTSMRHCDTNQGDYAFVPNITMEDEEYSY